MQLQIKQRNKFRPIVLPKEFRIERKESGESLTLTQIKSGEVYDNREYVGFVLRRHPSIGPLQKLDWFDAPIGQEKNVLRFFELNVY